MGTEDTSKLYKILPSEMGQDEDTTLAFTYVGDTGLDGDDGSQVTFLQFMNGTLYGLGMTSGDVWIVNTTDGSVTCTVRFPKPMPPGMELCNRQMGLFISPGPIPPTVNSGNSRILMPELLTESWSSKVRRRLRLLQHIL